MARMASQPIRLHRAGSSTASFSFTWPASRSRKKLRPTFLSSNIRASQSMDDKNKAFKELGLFSLRKKIEDAVSRAEMFAPTALELEEARRIKQEEVIREINLWDDPDKSNEILAELADSAKLVDALKDVTYKAEEAKLITQLSEMESLNYGLFKQAYDASVDVCKFLDQYEMSKLLKGPYDLEGACVIIKSGSKASYSEIWAEQLLSMYIKWAEKQGQRGRIVEKNSSKNGGIKSATIEFESVYAYGYLSGERGVHCMKSFRDGSVLREAGFAGVDVIPLFLDTDDLQLDEKDLIISSFSSHGEESGHIEPGVFIQHIPTCISIQYSGERSHFANKMKALNRLKAKLTVIAREQGVSSVNSINRDAIVHVSRQQTRKYVFHPYKLVQDVKTGIQLHDLNSVLNGNIEPFIGAHINIRQECSA
ncbi:peptide chain release factor PrfB3, chloroplastic [Malania oleifera]|uniref:peptide chain release factor PrfB3, chloroplastic n=1 Tax=Malania oleifera TaxID=397392 RepID=UPI0025AE4AFE|nr:peptide chain release factor PrfB3, chloroplastic [Malania oleifera]